MKIIKVETAPYNSNIFLVTLRPNLIEKWLGRKEVVWKFKDSGRHFTFGGGNCYVRSDGEETENNSNIGNAIDLFRRKF